MAEPTEELREQVTELLGEPNEAVVDALLVYATNKVAHVAGAALTARWRAEDELTEARAAIEHVRGIHRKSLFVAPNGTHHGKHYCMSCTFSTDDWTYYEPYPCPTALAVSESDAPAPSPATAATTEAQAYTSLLDELEDVDGTQEGSQ